MKKRTIIKKASVLLLTGLISISIFAGCGNGEITSDSKDLNSKFKWPERGIATLLPKPNSENGEILWEDSDSFSLDIYNCSMQDFDNYTDTCYDEGFSVDYSKSDTYYYSDNNDGYSLSVTLNTDDNIMNISITAPEEETTTEKTTQESSKAESSKAESSKAESSKTSDKVTTSFKETMDSYEQFMNQYVEFMKRYSESPDDLDMITEYIEMLQKYNELTEKINAIDEDSLSSADLAYYLEVTGRVTEKLTEIY